MPAMFASGWVMCWFSNGVVPQHTALRVWDALIVGGWACFFSVSLAIMSRLESQLCKCNFAEAVELLHNIPHEYVDDSNGLIEDANSKRLYISRKELKEIQALASGTITEKK